MVNPWLIAPPPYTQASSLGHLRSTPQVYCILAGALERGTNTQRPFKISPYSQPLSPIPPHPTPHTLHRLEQEQRAPPLRHATMLLLRKATALLGGALVLRYASPMSVLSLLSSPHSLVQINPLLPPLSNHLSLSHPLSFLIATLQPASPTSAAPLVPPAKPPATCGTVGSTEAVTWTPSSQATPSINKAFGTDPRRSCLIR